MSLKGLLPDYQSHLSYNLQGFEFQIQLRNEQWDQQYTYYHCAYAYCNYIDGSDRNNLEYQFLGD